MNKECSTNQVKIYCDPLGYMVSTQDKIVKENDNLIREHDANKADVLYIDSEEEIHKDKLSNYDKLYSPLDKIDNNAIGPWSPFLTKTCSKKGFDVMFKFSQKMFPGKFSIQPLSFQLPEQKEELRTFMQENPDKFFIAKPDELNVGAGVTVLDGWEDIDNQDQTEQYAVQQYINNPTQVSDAKRKVDFRVSYAEIIRDDEVSIYYNRANQGRVCPVTFEPLRKNCKSNRESHITCYQEVFEGDLYTPTDDLRVVNDKYNFMTYETIGKWFEDKDLYPNFLDKTNRILEDCVLQTSTVMAPFKKFFYELASRKQNFEKGIEFINYFGLDIQFDENLQPFWLEQNLASSNGDYNESQNTGIPANPAFIQFGKDAIELWIAAARDRKGYIHEKEIKSYKQIRGSRCDQKYKTEEDVQSKLFNLWIFLVTGKPEQPQLVEGEDVPFLRFPKSVTLDQLLKMAKMVPRVTETMITQRYEFFMQCNKDNIYLLGDIINHLYTREEILNMFEYIYNCS